MNVVIKVPGEAREHTVELRIENYRKGRAAITSGPPDNWEPAEGSEFDVVSAWMIRGKKYRLLSRSLRERIDDDFGDIIEDALDNVIPDRIS